MRLSLWLLVGSQFLTEPFKSSRYFETVSDMKRDSSLFTAENGRVDRPGVSLALVPTHCAA